MDGGRVALSEHVLLGHMVCFVSGLLCQWPACGNLGRQCGTRSAMRRLYRQKQQWKLVTTLKGHLSPGSP